MKYYVYIIFSKKKGTLYTGVTNNLQQRIYEHKIKKYEGFSKRYNIDKLGYYEEHNDIMTAIAREKQIKAGSRKKKIELIESMNPEWNYLYQYIF